MKPSEQLRELVKLLDHRCEGCEDSVSEHIHTPENCRRCKFESLIPAVEQLEYVQRERDAVIRGHLYDILNHTRMDIDASNAIREVIQKLGGVE